MEGLGVLKHVVYICDQTLYYICSGILSSDLRVTGCYWLLSLTGRKSKYDRTSEARALTDEIGLFSGCCLLYLFDCVAVLVGSNEDQTMK